MNPGMPKLITSFNGSLCAYLMRQNLHNRTRPRSYGSQCPCHISKWSVKIYGRESANGDFPCAKLQNAKKNCHFLCRLWKSPDFILINILSPTFVPNFFYLSLKYESTNAKRGRFNKWSIVQIRKMRKKNSPKIVFGDYEKNPRSNSSEILG